MGTYLDTIIDKILNERDGNWVIEYIGKPGWFLIDAGFEDGMAALIWAKSPILWLRWQSIDSVEEFIVASGINKHKVRAADVTRMCNSED